MKWSPASITIVALVAGTGSCLSFLSLLPILFPSLPPKVSGSLGLFGLHKGF